MDLQRCISFRTRTGMGQLTTGQHSRHPDEMGVQCGALPSLPHRIRLSELPCIRISLAAFIRLLLGSMAVRLR